MIRALTMPNPNPKVNHRISRLVEASAAIRDEVWGDAAFSHSLLCQVNLPYRNPGDELRVYQRQSGGVALRIEAGSVFNGRSFDEVGLPYGPRARLLMLHLCSLAVKQQSRVVEVDRSFTAFCKSLGISITGRNLRAVRDQIRRMSAVSMRLALNTGKDLVVFQGMMFDGLRAEMPLHADQEPLWSSEVRFSQAFYDSLQKHAVPLDLRAIKALRHSARGLDIYCWLASRLWRVKKPTKVRWTSLKWQFGQPEQNLESFKRAFKAALVQVKVVYPEARVEIVRGGVKLTTSAPPIPFSDNTLLVRNLLG